MELKRIEAIIEAILFASGDEVSSQILCKILEIDKKTLKNLINCMAEKYHSENRGIEIIVVEDSYQLRTRPDYFEYIKQLKEHGKKNRLSQAALETLSIIAYKQPITKVEIEQIRGVGCYTSLLRLMENNLIMEIGRMEAPGRPILYGTTEEFLKSFGLKSVGELPSLEMFEDQIEFLNCVEDDTQG